MTFINSLKDIIQKNKLLIQNFSFLSLLQLFNLIIPLATYPYLIRVIGKNVYGNVIFAASFAAYFSIVVNFGFNIYATKFVSINRDNKFKLSEIVSSVFIIKGFVFLLCLIVFFVVMLCVPQVKDDYLLYFFSFLICVSEVVFPVWFFQGIERMKYITYINLLTRLIFTLLVFVLVKNKNDYLFIPFLQFMGALLGGVLALVIIIQKSYVKFFIPKYTSLKIYFFGSLPFFLSRISGIFNSETNTIIIGTFLTMGDVAFYDLAKKIINLLLVPFNLINQTIYPNVSKSKNMNFVRKVIRFNIFLAIVLYFGVLAFGQLFIEKFAGIDLLPAYDILIIMALILPINAVTYFLGNTVLVVMGYSKYFNKSVIFAFLFYLLMIFIIVLCFNISLLSLSILFVLIGVFDLLYRGYYVFKFKLLYDRIF